MGSLLNEISATLSAKIGEVNQASGTEINSRADRQGGLLTSQLHGRYTEQALNGNLFMVSNQAAVATTAALATTWTGLCVSNPSTSRYNMALLEFGAALAVAGSDDGAMGLLMATIAAPASVVAIKNCFLGGRSSVMMADDGATLVGPYLLGTPFAYGTGATNLVNQTGAFCWKIDGAIIVPPGYTIANYTTTATTAAFVFYYIWEEIPI